MRDEGVIIPPMLLDRLGIAWKAFEERARSEARVLVVVRDPEERRDLVEGLARAGLAAEGTATLAGGREALARRAPDLLVVDHRLGDGSGLALVESEAERLPAVVITGEPSATGVMDVFTVGARELLVRPFADPDRALARIVAVLDHHLAGRLHARMVEDLSGALAEEGRDRDRVRAVAARLGAFKRSLARRPSVLVVEDNPAVAEVVRRALERVGLSVRHTASVTAARAAVGDGRGPLAALVDVDVEGAVDLVRSLKAADPALEVVVTTGAGDTAAALASLAAGAHDYVIRQLEGVEALQARLGRAVARSRRRRLSMFLLQTLHAAAREAGDAVAERFLARIPAAEPVVLDESDGSPAEDPARLFEEGSGREGPVRSAAPRRPEVVIRPATGDDAALPLVEPELLDPLDRRDWPRVEAGLEVRFREVGEDDFIYCHLRDLSAGGLFLHVDPPLPVGAHLSLEVLLGWDAEPLHLKGEVVRAVHADPDHPARSGIGVRVDAPGDETLRRVVRRFYEAAPAGGR